MRRILTTLLLLFAGATTFKVVLAEVFPPREGEAPRQALEIPPRGEALGVYYFLVGNKRCSTCRAMEAHTRAAVKERLSKGPAAGKVLFAVVNTERPEFRHYKEDFRLPSTSLVLARYKDGRLLRFVNLNLIWRLARDRKAFLDYVEKEARALLEERP